MSEVVSARRQKSAASTASTTAEQQSKRVWLVSIDYGTSSIKAYYVLAEEDGKDMRHLGKPIPVIWDHESSNLLPAAVAYDKGEFFCGNEVGTNASSGNLPFEKIIRAPKLALHFKRGEHEQVDQTLALLKTELSHRKGLHDDRFLVQEMVCDHMKAIVEKIRAVLEHSDEYAGVPKTADGQPLPIYAKLGVPVLWKPIMCTVMQHAAERADLKSCQIVPEPVCTFASCITDHNSRIGSAKVQLHDGEAFIVCDWGALTLDISVFRAHVTATGDVWYERLPSPPGNVNSSGKVDEIIFATCMDFMKAKTGNRNWASEEARRLGVSLQHFQYKFMEKVVEQKQTYKGTMLNWSVVIDGSSSQGSAFNSPLFPTTIIRDAICKVVDPAIELARGITTKDKLAPKTIIVAGGFTNSPLLRSKMTEELKKENVQVTYMMTMFNGAAHQVAYGAISEFYEKISGKHFFPTSTYALLRDEIFRRDQHPDCMIDERGKRARADPNKVARYYITPVPSDRSEDAKKAFQKQQERDNPRMVLDRLAVFMSKRETATGSKTISVPIDYCPLESLLFVSVRIVRTESDYKDHDAALAHDHNVTNENNALKDDVEEVAEMVANLDKAELDQYGFQRYADPTGRMRYKLSADIQITYVQELQMSAAFLLKPPNGGGVLRVECEHRIWSAAHSQFQPGTAQEHEQFGEARQPAQKKRKISWRDKYLPEAADEGDREAL